jgi:dephospho-CoA kinase
MKTWIVTGGVASGKSQLCGHLKELVPDSIFFSSDEVVHGLLDEAESTQAISHEFGAGILEEEGRVSRAALRRLVFADPKARKRLESLLHPRVYRALEQMKDRLEQDRNTQLLIAEIPLFYEASAEFPADLVIVVATGATLQQERLTGPRSLDPDTAERIRAAQWPLSRKLEPADRIVWNEGSLALLKLQAKILVQQLDPS